MVKNLPAMRKTQVQSLGQEDPLRRKWQPTPVFLPAEFHGQRSPLGYSPCSHKELSDCHVHISFSLKTACVQAQPQSYLTFCDPARLLCLWDFPGKSPGVGFHFFLHRRQLLVLFICRLLEESRPGPHTEKCSFKTWGIEVNLQVPLDQVPVPQSRWISVFF